MAKKKQEFVKQDEQLQEVNEALTGAGKWIEENASLISWVVAGVAVVVLACIAINQYVFKPKALEASNENAKAVVYFMNGDFDKALKKLLIRTIREHRQIIFNGNGYSDEWIAEAEKRGLPNLVSTVDCVPLYTKDEYVSLFERFKVYSRVEIESRTEILLENYTKVITIEALTMLDMVRKQILPAAVRYNKEICDAALSKKALGLDNALEVGMASKLSALTAAISESVRTLDDKLTAVQSICGNEASAKFCRSDVFTVMQELRTLVDELETNMPAKDWPLPSYTDLLFNV